MSVGVICDVSSRPSVRPFVRQAINVIEIDEDNFKAVTDGSKNVLLKFYTPDCYMCEEIEPEFLYAASKYDEK